ncbi:hypothetical protein [Nocardioides astragali]|uniref:Uncharacterized protein n=1 Tax=Nocardioides astragali TaxID=1776736 RepID=A0ABW2N6R9_9ACTN|nr:hypothetical protein [Nocardioides astragali]
MAQYVIRVRGRLSAELTESFPSLEVVPAAPMTVLHGHLPDQAALGGVLTHLDLLGVEILEVLQVPPTSAPVGGSASPESGETHAVHEP